MKVISLILTIILALVLVSTALARTDDLQEPVGKAYPPPVLTQPKYLPEVFTGTAPSRLHVPLTDREVHGTRPKISNLEDEAPARRDGGVGSGYSGPLPWIATPRPPVSEATPYPGP